MDEERHVVDQSVYVDDFGVGHIYTYYDDGTEEYHRSEDYDEIYGIDPDEAKAFEYFTRESPY